MLTLETMTLGQIEEIELLTGKSIDVAFNDGEPKGRALRAIYFVAMKTENPDYKFEETAKITQLEALRVLGGIDPKDES